eukprot:SAG31_NODE_9522_length_1264_cov_1.546781_2_plen_49_part_01
MARAYRLLALVVGRFVQRIHRLAVLSDRCGVVFRTEQLRPLKDDTFSIS